MSQSRPDLDLSVKGLNTVVKFLSGMVFVNEVYVNGSRSPVSPRKARSDSDWDLICIVNEGVKVRNKSVRDTHKFHADVIYITKKQLIHYNQAAQIWPSDEHGVLNNG